MGLQQTLKALADPIRREILNLLKKLQQDHNLTYMFITHNLAVVKHISDVIMVMYLGQCVEIAEADERKRMLYRAKNNTRENHRNVIVLYHFCGRSYEDIAAILGIGIGTVKSRLNRAKAELKKILTERNFFA